LSRKNIKHGSFTLLWSIVYLIFNTKSVGNGNIKSAMFWKTQIIGDILGLILILMKNKNTSDSWNKNNGRKFINYRYCRLKGVWLSLRKGVYKIYRSKSLPCNRLLLIKNCWKLFLTCKKGAIYKHGTHYGSLSVW